MKVNILGVEVDKITQKEAIGVVLKWLKSNGRYYIVTPNVEMVILAQGDKEFRKIINQADMAIPDSARFGWAEHQINSRNSFNRLTNWPMFLFSKVYSDFPVTTGVDLTKQLIKEAAEKGLVIGFLGSSQKVAINLVERLKKRYPKLKIALVDPDIEVDSNGNQKNDQNQLDRTEISIDILFVALGHGKQEKWIAKNRHKYQIKVMIGVGGALDYLSGSVQRSPKWLQSLGFEWLFRLIIQPWRIKRFDSLIKFIFLVGQIQPSKQAA